MMQLNCEKALLQNAINTAGRTVSPKSSVPALEGLLLHGSGDGVTVSGYNMSTGIRIRVPADVRTEGDIVLSARLFGDIVRRMPDDMVAITVEDSLLVRLRCGDSDFQITGIAAGDFPDLPQVEGDCALTLKQGVLKAMIEQTAYAVSTSDSRPVHTGALFEAEHTGLTIVAVDGFRLAVRREPLDKVEGGAFSFVAPGAALNEVKNICADSEDPVTITLGKRHILFEIADAELICRRLEGEFLNYRKTIPRNQPVAVTVNTRDLMNSIERVSVVISEKLKSPVRCTFGQDRVSLYAQTPAGEARDVCPVQGDGGGLEIGFNNRYLLDALRYAPAETVRVEMNNGVSPAVLVPVEGEENFLYMVLPVRLRA